VIEKWIESGCWVKSRAKLIDGLADHFNKGKRSGELKCAEYKTGMDSAGSTTT
jgi:hypothetical protein